MRRILRLLTHAGADALPLSEQKYIVLCNQFAIFLVVLDITAISNPSIAYDRVVQFTFVVQSAGFALVVGLNALGYTLISRTFFAIWGALTVAALAALLGPRPDQGLFLVPVILGVWTLFP